MKKSDFTPRVKLAPAGELKAYVVFEHQLDLLEQGSPASLMLNFSLFFLGIAGTAFGTLCTISPTNIIVFCVFFMVFITTLIAGILTGSLWRLNHKSAKSIIHGIKAQMPPNPPVHHLPYAQLADDGIVEPVLRSSEEADDEVESETETPQK
jgi:hypothetical protein